MDGYCLEIWSYDDCLLESFEFEMKTLESAIRRAKKQACVIFSNVGYARYPSGYAILQTGDCVQVLRRWILERAITIKPDQIP